MTELEADAVVLSVFPFPSGRTIVVVLEREVRFVATATRRVRYRDDWVHPYTHGSRVFTPRGRMLARWSAGSCLGEAQLVDERGRILPCARNAELSPEHRYAVTVDHYGRCAAAWTNAHRQKMIEVVDLDTCRTVEERVMPPEFDGGSEVDFLPGGVVVRFEGGRSVVLPYP